MRGEAPPQRPVLAHGNFWGQPLVSWRSGRWKLILDPRGGQGERVELYDLEADPGERTDLAPAQPERVAALLAEYRSVEALLEARAEGRPVELDEAGKRRLQALGYMGSEELEEAADADGGAE